MNRLSPRQFMKLSLVTVMLSTVGCQAAPSGLFLTDAQLLALDDKIRRLERTNDDLRAAVLRDCRVEKIPR